MFGRVSYWSEAEVPGVGSRYDIVDPRTGSCFPYVKSVDIELGIVEEALYDGFMTNGRPRPRMLHGKPMTRTRIVPFNVVEKASGKVIYWVGQ